MKELEQEIQQVRAQLGRNVQKARRDRGLSLDSLATEVGVSPEQMAAIEAGACDVPIDTLVQLARALGVTLSQLFAEG